MEEGEGDILFTKFIRAKRGGDVVWFYVMEDYYPVVPLQYTRYFVNGDCGQRVWQYENMGTKYRGYKGKMKLLKSLVEVDERMKPMDVGTVVNESLRHEIEDQCREFLIEYKKVIIINAKVVPLTRIY